MGLVGNMDLADNMMLRSFRQGHSPFTDRKQPRQLANDVVESLEVVTRGFQHRYGGYPEVMYKRCWLDVKLHLLLPYY